MGRRSVVAHARLLLSPIVLCGCVVSGCATTTTVETRGGATYEARVLGGSPGAVFLSNKDNGHFTVRREDVADVDYPGNVVLMGGIALGAVGGWRLRVGDTHCGTFGDVGLCLLNAAPVIIGFLATMWGAEVYGHAKRAYEDRSKPEPDPVMRPGPVGPALHLPGWRKPDPFAEPNP